MCAPVEPTSVASGFVVTARQYDDPSSCGDRARQDEVRQRTACVRGYDDIVRRERDVLDRSAEHRHPSRKARPRRVEHGGERIRAGWNAQVGGDGGGRRVVEQEHQTRDEAMPAREVDDPTTAKAPARPARDLPRLVELFARQAIGFAHDARDAVEQRVALEMARRRGLQTHATSRIEHGRMLLDQLTIS